jgi:hypothetical protein
MAVKSVFPQTIFLCCLIYLDMYEYLEYLIITFHNMQRKINVCVCVSMHPGVLGVLRHLRSVINETLHFKSKGKGLVF